MYKFFWLTSLTVLCCCAVNAQQDTNDSLSSRQSLLTEKTDSLFTRIACTVKDRDKILVEWAADSIEEGNYFIVERSNDGIRFETIGALKVVGHQSQYELADNAPFNGSNFYRIKYSGPAGEVPSSKTVRVVLSENAAFRFYPNPVDKLLIIQTDHSASVQIVSSFGEVRISSQLQPGVQVINVSSLEKGTYLLRVTDKESKRDIVEQLLKK